MPRWRLLWLLPVAAALTEPATSRGNLRKARGWLGARRAVGTSRLTVPGEGTRRFVRAAPESRAAVAAEWRHLG
ncbi:unnamed protein product [Lampetra planeri]